MRTRWILGTGLVVLSLACGGGGGSGDPEPTDPDSEPLVQEDLTPLEPLTAQDGYAYIPGRNGVEDARFMDWNPRDRAVVGAIDDKVHAEASEASDVIATLDLGLSIEIVGSRTDPVVVDGQRGRWYRVAAESGVEGYLFSASISALGGTFSSEEMGDGTWAVTFNEDFGPRVHIKLEDGQIAVGDVEATERYRGGRLEANWKDFGDFARRLDVTQCALEEEHEPDCSTATVALVYEDSELQVRQVTPVDAWRFAAEEFNANRLTCSTATPLVVDTSGAKEDEPRVMLELPSEQDGPEPQVPCQRMGVVTEGGYSGREMVSCTVSLSEKAEPDSEAVLRYLTGVENWIYLPCGSSTEERQKVNDRLAEQGIKVRVEYEVRVPDTWMAPETLHADELGRATLVRRSPRVPEAVSLSSLFEHNELGTVFAATAMHPGGLLVPTPEGGSLVYGWEPRSLAVQWSGTEPEHEKSYSHTTPGCADDPFTLLHVEPEIDLETLTPVGTLPGRNTVYALPDARHPAARRLLADFRRDLRRGRWTGAPSPSQRDAELLRGYPWLFIADSWGRTIRLLREDMVPPAMCEPILYAYSSPPRPLSIVPMEPLEVAASAPRVDGEDGWQGWAQPDGTWLSAQGKRYPYVFWEGTSVVFDRPEGGWVVRGPEVESLLQTVLPQLGLQGREIDEFIDAWAEPWSVHPWVRIAPHSRATIDAVAPLALDPEPDVFLRVLLEAEPLDAPVVVPAPALAPVGPRYGLTVVEWGGVTRR